MLNKENMNGELKRSYLEALNREILTGNANYEINKANLKKIMILRKKFYEK